MKKVFYKSLLFLLAILVGFLVSLNKTERRGEEEFESEGIHSTSSPEASIEAKKERAEYFFRMLKDPTTNKIPKGIRQKELAFAKELKAKSSLNKTDNLAALSWKEAGPKDVGGRTRALAVDVTNSNTILAGGVSGGIWKSTDKGATWSMKSSTSQVLSVTCIAQDPRNGHTNTWYYASGEYDGSCQDLGYTAWFTGGGIYKSTDNGETWSLLPNASNDNIAQWSTPFDYVSNIKVNPATGSIFIASNGVGILRSTDGGNSFYLVLGGNGEHIYNDIDIAANGTIVAIVSSPYQNVTPTNQPGVYKSTDDGNNWTSITPTSFPSTHYRSEIKIAPSNPDVCYVITYTGSFINEKYDDIRFYKINIVNGTAEDRTANLPNFGQDFEDYINTQNNYNLVMAVKPDDENFVLIGATSLFRSTDGFSTKPDNAKLQWIGGYSYSNDAFFYPNFHPDIHSFAFDPNNPNAMWWGHDGGLSYTSDISNTSYATFFPWENMNNGYNVTQFYMVAIPDEANDPRIMGGTQDNGTPSFRFDGTTTTESYDVSTGDGAYAYFGNNYPYVSSQNGLVVRAKYDAAGNPIRQYPDFSNITPVGAQNQLFINPYVIDPNNENIMIYPAGNTLWRNNQLNSLPDNPDFSNGLSQGWTSLGGAAPDGYVITAMAMSVNSPSSRLYYAAVDFSQNGNGAPKLYRLDNAQTGTSVVDISIDGLQNGMYIHNIAVNPNNGDEILVIISNYNVMGIYHSTNGGTSFTGVEGNLEGTQNNPGPSIRGASILPYNGVTRYFVGTSIGVFSTTSLNGSSTVWEQEGADVIGNLIVNYIASRPSDGRVVAGSHGRGAFVSDGSASSAPRPTTDVQSLALHARPGETGSTSFVLSNEGGSALTFNISITGDLLTASPLGYHQVLKGGKVNSGITLQSKFKELKTDYTGKLNGVKATCTHLLTKPLEISGNDVLFMDDGDESADGFIGWDNASDFYWANEFNISGFNFSLDEIQFFMKTENAITNILYIAIYDQDQNLLSDGVVSYDLSADGTWYSATIDPVIEFNDGQSFFVVLGTQGSFIYYPAGLDYDATVPNKSYYFDGSEWVLLSSISGYENAAFLIRAVGTAGTGANQNPVAVANVNPTQANVNDPITFDASGSYDNDGQITQYQWNFGDGASSNQVTVQHSYSQANTYTYTLTVTDDKGATNQTTGQVTISQKGSTKVTAQPSSGTINPGGSQTIIITLDASTVTEGNYVGQVNIATNGGNIVLPIDYTVDVEKIEGLPTEYSLSQNYPNPFNPSTMIEFAIPKSEDVTLKVYDILGREIATLIDERLSAGNYKVKFDANVVGQEMSSGVYIYRLKTKEYADTKKLVLLK